MKVWVVTGNTESGDRIGPHVYTSEPSEAQLRALAEWDHWSEECPAYHSPELEQDCSFTCECGPGDYGSYSFFDVEEVEVE